jgi:hypothetical protein
MAVLQSLWEGWSGQNLSSPQQGQSIDNRTETRQLLNVILDYINSAENTNKRVRSKERIAGIKADLNRQQDLLDLQVKLAGVEGKANEAKLRSLTSLTEASLKSWTKYLTDTSQAYSRALMVFDNERRKFGKATLRERGEPCSVRSAKTLRLPWTERLLSSRLHSLR